MRVLLAFLSLTLLSTQSHAQLCIAHRGDSINNVDNTLEAVKSGWDAGADIVEVDVRMLVDNTLVLFHDEDIQGILLSTLTYPQLQEFTPRYHVPTLKELLAANPDGKILLLDLKSPTPLYLEKLLGVLQENAINEKTVILQSKDLPSLQKIRSSRFSNFRLFYVTSLERGGALQQRPDAETLAKELKKAGLNGVTAKGRRSVDRSYVKAFQDLGLQYFVWTINEADRIRHYADIGVDGIITDDPKTVKETIGTPAGP